MSGVIEKKQIYNASVSTPNYEVSDAIKDRCTMIPFTPASLPGVAVPYQMNSSMSMHVEEDAIKDRCLMARFAHASHKDASLVDQTPSGQKIFNEAGVRQCDQCRTESGWLRCATCKRCYYCSIACQALHYRLIHSKECRQADDIAPERQSAPRTNLIQLLQDTDGPDSGRLARWLSIDRHNVCESLGGWLAQYLRTNPGKTIGELLLAAHLWEIPTREAVGMIREFLQRKWMEQFYQLDVDGKKKPLSVAQGGEKKHSKRSVLTVLEIGAGRGLWSYLLKQACDPTAFQFIATDIEPQERSFLPVEKLSAVEAFVKYKSLRPVVLASWFPEELHLSSLLGFDRTFAAICIGPKDTVGKPVEEFLPSFDCFNRTFLPDKETDVVPITLGHMDHMDDKGKWYYSSRICFLELDETKAKAPFEWQRTFVDPSSGGDASKGNFVSKQLVLTGQQAILSSPDP